MAFPDLIQELKESRGLLNNIPCTTIRTTLDGRIIPSWSTELAKADSHVVINPGHGWLLSDPRVHRIVVNAIADAEQRTCY